ncbi:unnamed protein product [Nyctereutes procyonoides]|uniref:(raccoon dog) hypothetical protein n=1 Tax=Nyctereutes procyonoides TaxID=34880 RepID=A0A811YPX0_NYCPR|nr:unnamed protein product [Nyctereutes procyonoides]
MGEVESNLYHLALDSVCRMPNTLPALWVSSSMNPFRPQKVCSFL